MYKVISSYFLHDRTLYVNTYDGSRIPLGWESGDSIFHLKRFILDHPDIFGIPNKEYKVEINSENEVKINSEKKLDDLDQEELDNLIVSYEEGSYRRPPPLSLDDVRDVSEDVYEVRFRVLLGWAQRNAMRVRDMHQEFSIENLVILEMMHALWKAIDKPSVTTDQLRGANYIDGPADQHLGQHRLILPIASHKFIIFDSRLMHSYYQRNDHTTTISDHVYEKWVKELNSRIGKLNSKKKEFDRLKEQSRENKKDVNEELLALPPLYSGGKELHQGGSKFRESQKRFNDIVWQQQSKEWLDSIKNMSLAYGNGN